MFRNYLLTTFRNITRRKGFSILYVLGLSIGLAASLLILQYVKDELSYDSFHEQADLLYRVQYDYYQDGEVIFKSATSFPKMAPTLKSDFPEIENSCRLYLQYGGGVIRYNDISMKEDNLFLADQSFLEMFSYPLVSGDRNTALKEPNTAVVEMETAKKYFGDQDPIGKRIRLGSNQEYEITGVIQSPEKSHLKFSFLFSYTTYPGLEAGAERNNWEEAWGWYDFYNYIQLKPGADPKNLEAKFPAYIKKYGDQGDEKKIVFSLQRLKDIHLYSDLIQEARVNGNGQSVYFLAIIAFFILIIAWVNYINLATARAVERAKEVGVRKAIGAARSQLMGQFIAEAFMVNLIAVIVALALLNLAVPVFNELAGKELTLSIFGDLYFWYAVGLLFLVGSALSGLYPAFVLSAYQPARVLKGSMKGTRKGMLLRKGLVITQFVASVALIAGTIIVQQQLKFMQNRDLGIDIEQTLVINAPGVVTNDSLYTSAYNSYKNEMLNHPSVKNMAGSTEIPGNLIYWTNGSKRIGLDQEQASLQMYIVGVDHDFFTTYGNKILAGRGFGREFTDGTNIVVNRKAATDFGFKNLDEAVGGKVRIGGDTLTIVGVIENYHQEGLKVDFRPTTFRFFEAPQAYFSAKVKAEDMGQTIAYAKEKYALLFPGNPFDYFFLDTFFNRQYKGDQQFGKVFGLFSLLAIFVASLGLFGLASFTASQRTKEIGIRKVLGSSVPNIFLLLSKDFLKLVIIANVIAIPLVWLLMDKWLNSFAFRIDIGIWIFIVATVITTLIALATVSYQSITAAVANPVKSLRYE